MILSKEVLDSQYGSNYIIQECMQQMAFMASFNPSSVNTIRVMTYRSVKDDDVKFCNAVLRIGGKGSDVDNAHAGGKFCGIDQNGVLGKYVCDFLGRKDTIFNGVDFTREKIIPNYDTIKTFSINVASKIPYMRLLALDIMIDASGTPRLIEFNCTSFSYWLFQFTNGCAYGQYTDEVIEYAIKNHHLFPMKAISF